MQRLTARLLLLFALLGTFLPIALEATSAPSHACCRRTSAHHCNESVGTTDETIVRSNAGCCNQNCYRAVTTSQWANPEPLRAGTFAPRTTTLNPEPQSAAPITELFSSQSTRAPPAC